MRRDRLIPSDRTLRRSGKATLDSGTCGDGALYHVTRASLLPSIREHGLVSGPANFRDFEQWSDGKVFFAAGEDAMYHWQEIFLTSQRLHQPVRFADMLVLRVRPGSRVYGRVRRDAKADHPCSFYVLGRVPPEDLEQLNIRDEWEGIIAPVPRKRAARKNGCQVRSRLEVARMNPLRRPSPDYRAFLIPWGLGLAAGVVEGPDAIGGVTLKPYRDGLRVHAAAAVRGYGPLAYDVAATLTGKPIYPSDDQSDEARAFWSRVGGQIEPLSPASFQAKYGISLASMTLDTSRLTERQISVLRDAIYEAEDVAEDASQQRHRPPHKRTVPRLYREQKEYRERLARASRQRSAKARARRNPTASAQPLFVDILAHLHALKWVYWTTHWTAAGPNFYGTHLLLQRLYEGKKGGPDIDEQIDQLGERMVAYFGPGSVQPLEIQHRSSALIEAAQGGDPLRTLVRLEDSLQESIRRAWDAEQQAGSARSLGIDDYLMGLANERDTARYLLKRQVGG